MRLGRYNTSSRVVSVNFFQTRSDDIIAVYMDIFNCLPVDDVIVISLSVNTLCQICYFAYFTA